MRTHLSIFLYIALSIIGFRTVGAESNGKWKLYVVDGDPGCEGWHNGSTCQQICIYSEGKDAKGKFSTKQGCTKANYINSYDRLQALKKRVSQVENAMNKSGLGWSQDDLKEGFYSLAQKIDPEIKPSDSESSAPDANK